ETGFCELRGRQESGFFSTLEIDQDRAGPEGRGVAPSEHVGQHQAEDEGGGCAKSHDPESQPTPPYRPAWWQGGHRRQSLDRAHLDHPDRFLYALEMDGAARDEVD